MIELDDIVGQEEAIRRLRQAAASRRTPHAYLFVGHEGVGRRTTALAFAKLLLCRDPAEARACGTCESCKLFDAGTHPDLHMVYKELARYHDKPEVRNQKMQNLGIPVIRQFLIDPAWRASSLGRGKVFIVAQADLMTGEAQDALLKTLEEPPAGVTIILIAHHVEQLLPTTQSRCQVVRFGSLPEAFIVSRLGESGISETEATFWARLCEGSLGEAMDFAARGLYDVKVALLEELARADEITLSEKLAAARDALAEALIKDAKKDKGIELAGQLASRRAAAVILRLIAGAFRDALAGACGSTRPAVNEDQSHVVEALRRRFDVPQLGRIVEQLADYETLLRRNVNPKTVWDNVALTCTHTTIPTA